MRRDLAWNGVTLDKFHATADMQDVRDAVFEVIARSDVRIDATILDKRKTVPRLAQDHVRFYKQAMYMHFKYVVPHVTSRGDRLSVVASSLQIRKKRGAVHDAVKDVVDQAARCKYITQFTPSQADPCLQVADYVTWAIQRRYERDDDRSYATIQHLVRSEFEPFRHGRTTYY